MVPNELDHYNPFDQMLEFTFLFIFTCFSMSAGILMPFYAISSIKFCVTIFTAMLESAFTVSHILYLPVTHYRFGSLSQISHQYTSHHITGTPLCILIIFEGIFLLKTSFATTFTEVLTEWVWVYYPLSFEGITGVWLLSF